MTSLPEAEARPARTALVADDDLAFRLLLDAALTRLGFRVTLVIDGLAALERAVDQTFDLIILDVLMPGADGYEVCRALRALPAYQKTPILVLTGLEDHSSVGQAFAAGATDFERKPLNINLLSHRILFLAKAAENLRELDAKRAELEHQATHDAMTGLANRAALARFGERLTADAAPGRCTALLYIDLDGFKAINDAYGHPFGDRLLREIVQRIRSVVPTRYLVARVGGDEFVVVIDGLDDTSYAESLAAEILAAIGDPFRIDEQEFCIGASIGMAAHPQHGATMDELLKNADIAMYRAKQLGRRRFQAFDDRLALEVLERTALQNDLRRALQNDEFELVYQPLFNLTDGKIEAAEALLRWNHPSRGLIEPKRFIPLAESTGLLPQIGRWVLERAAYQAGRWCRPPFALRHVSVNLSGADIRRADFIPQLRSLIDRHGIEPRMLQVEVSEPVSGDLADSEDTLQALRAIRALGLGLAIDDFGTGRSSVPGLERFPASTLKIDVSLVRRLLDSAADRSVMRGIIALGRGLGLTLIAVGIESREQMAWLREAGCNLGQGFAFARPMPADTLESLLATRQGFVEAALPAEETASRRS